MAQIDSRTPDHELTISDVIDVIGSDIMAEVKNHKMKPLVKIVEQPAPKALRFRYECEGRSAGSIPGRSSQQDNKTYPSIQVMGHVGRAVVVVSCVTKDSPYRPHPHNLVGKEGCKKGVCTMQINTDSMTCTFSNLGIQCVKKKDIDEALRVREEMRVDPFATGFSHRDQPSSIDLNAVRLCFQVFLEGSTKGKFDVPLDPVVSDVIYDKKAMSDLVICKLSHCSASVLGGVEVMLFCEKVAKDDIEVRFYEEKDNQLVWEAVGEFQPTDVHKQVGIAFKTPSYKNLQVESIVKANIQLRRPSDGAASEPLAFDFLPMDSARTTGPMPMMHSVKPEPTDSVSSHAIGPGRVSPLYELPSTSPQPLMPQPVPSYMEPSLAPSISPLTLATAINPATSMGYMQPPHLRYIPETTNPQCMNIQGPSYINCGPSTVVQGTSWLQDPNYMHPGTQFSINVEGTNAIMDNSVFDVNLSDTFSNNLSLTDVENSRPVQERSADEPMSTDSLNRMTTRALEELCNSTYKGGGANTNNQL